MRINFNKVDTLPAVLQTDAFYFVDNGVYAESYLTDSTGTAKAIGNSAMINALVADALANWTGESSQVTIVANIAARDAAIASAETNLMLLVIDATGDSTVESGSALYAYDLATDTTYKIAEYESMDVILNWVDIVGGPTSTPVQIDDAVDQAHTHANKAVLDLIGEDAEENLTFRGEAVKTQWETLGW